MTTSYIIQTASAKCPRSWAWRHERRRVAVLEVEPGVERVAMISDRARGVVRVVKTWEHCYVGLTDRCAYARALAEAETLIEERLIRRLGRAIVDFCAAFEAARQHSINEARRAMGLPLRRRSFDRDGNPVTMTVPRDDRSGR